LQETAVPPFSAGSAAAKGGGISLGFIVAYPAQTISIKADGRCCYAGLRNVSHMRVRQAGIRSFKNSSPHMIGRLTAFGQT
jgi:hypothetical protein